MKSRCFAHRASSFILLGLFITFAAFATPTKSIRLRNETITTELPTAQTARTAPAPAAAPTAESPALGLFLIQFETIPTPTERQELNDLGVDLLSYVPDDAFIADASNVPPDTTPRPALRPLGRTDEAGTQDSRQTDQPASRRKPMPAADLAVSVLLAPRARPTTPRQREVNSPACGAKPNCDRAPSCAVVFRANKLQQLAESPAVLWIEPAPRMKLQDEIATKIVAGDDGNAGTLATVHQLGFTGAGVTVAVADSGLDSGDIDDMHPDIAGRVTALFHYGARG